MRYVLLALRSFIFLQYIPDVSRAVFGLLTAMQKRARDSEEGNAGGASKRAKGGGSGSGGTTVSSASKVMHKFHRVSGENVPFSFRSCMLTIPATTGRFPCCILRNF